MRAKMRIARREEKKAKVKVRDKAHLKKLKVFPRILNKFNNFYDSKNLIKNT
jgi:hypothetical protein